MKKWECNACDKPIEVTDDYEPEFCCGGYMCGCYGMPVNPAFCDNCERKILGVEVDVDEKRQV